MRKFLMAAALMLAVAGTLASSRAEAMTVPLPASPPSIIEQVALCFYLDGWNGPGMYQCGYRLRRGEGWHSRRDEYRYDRRPLRCPRGYTVQDGVCKPYRGY